MAKFSTNPRARNIHPEDLYKAERAIILKLRFRPYHLVDNRFRRKGLPTEFAHFKTVGRIIGFGLASINQGCVTITPVGREFAGMIERYERRVAAQ